ncbi:monoogygenase CPUR_05431 [Colletotrichum spaethianum]|uniref:Monoogygenase CPUR_05431 n=1 Tax=Colletotrichum spaethianum TaxID=700344 RepID=A0AA37LGE6_9PEZI|nr:monoogygenase CPUR_05431 [Colletotrichum spaethianum]GKT46023.1 monoogygenase CPUR_05431 [Colletotrichum spaethianum]
MNKLYDVIIAGAGPVGLLLACELGLARMSVLVLERDAAPESPWKTQPFGFRGLQTSSIEILNRRGLIDKFFDLSERPHSPKARGGSKFGGHFAGIMLDMHKLDLTRHKYCLTGPSLMPAPTTIEKIETILTERAESLGVEILRGHGFDRIVQEDDGGIIVEAGGNDKHFRARWLVGCDGGRSRVRKAAGFEFVGTEATLTGYSLRCDIDHPEKLKMGFNPTENGFYIFSPWGVFALMDFDGGAGQTQELTQERMQDVLERVIGKTDLHITKLHLASVWTDRSKQTTNLRKGRVLLAGDAAHIHPPFGAQGMNAGLGDAMNLGWKLAATIRGEKREGGLSHFKLLDTYEKERHPIGASVLDWNRAQAATMQPTPTGRALRALATDLIKTNDGVNHFIDRVWGLSQRYSLGDDEHPLVGCSAPDFVFKDGSRLNPKLVKGQGLLLNFGEDKALEVAIQSDEYGGLIDYLHGDVQDRLGISALLIRCDGFVAWVAEESSQPDIARLKTALDTWFHA